MQGQAECKSAGTADYIRGKEHKGGQEYNCSCTGSVAKSRGRWSKRLTWRLQRCLFIALVQGAALSGLEALDLEETHYQMIDKAMVRMLRALKGGAQVDCQGHTKTLSSETSI